MKKVIDYIINRLIGKSNTYYDPFFKEMTSSRVRAPKPNTEIIWSGYYKFPNAPKPTRVLLSGNFQKPFLQELNGTKAFCEQANHVLHTIEPQLVTLNNTQKPEKRIAIPTWKTDYYLAEISSYADVNGLELVVYLEHTNPDITTMITFEYINGKIIELEIL